MTTQRLYQQGRSSRFKRCGIFVPIIRCDDYAKFIKSFGLSKSSELFEAAKNRALNLTARPEVRFLRKCVQEDEFHPSLAAFNRPKHILEITDHRNHRLWQRSTPKAWQSIHHYDKKTALKISSNSS